MAERIKVEAHGGLGVVWFVGWLFSVGYLGLGFWKGLLGLFIWPYFIGAHMAEPAPPPAPAPTVQEERAGAPTAAP